MSSKDSKEGITPPPARLDSLNRRPIGSTGSTSNRKFQPKAVARRTKEERAATAPVEKIEDSKDRIKNHPLSGRGGRGGRGSRGRGKFSPVTSAAIGPLAAPTSALTRPTRIGGPRIHADISGSSTASNFKISDFVPRRIKSETPGIETSEEPEEDNEHRVNMTSDQIMDGAYSQYFPIRLQRSVIEEDELGVSAEVTDDKKSADGIKFQSIQEVKEYKSMKNDREIFMNEFGTSRITTEEDDDKTAIKGMENSLYFFQFPVVLPEFESLKLDDPPVKAENDDDVIMVDEDQKEEEKAANGEASSAETATIRAFSKGVEQVKHQIPSGTGGKLRLHKSGKLTMTLGNIVMEVNQGTESNFLQDVVVMNEEEKRAYLIGQIARKMVVSPDITQISSS